MRSVWWLVLAGPPLLCASSVGAASLFPPTCKDSAARVQGAGSAEWNGWSPSVTNSRFQEADAAGLDAAGVRRLKLKWAFNLGDVTMARSQPAVAGGILYIGTQTGAVYALDAAIGCTHWGFKRRPASDRASLWDLPRGRPRSFSATPGPECMR